LRRDLQHARDLIRLCQIENFRKIALDDRFNVRAAPILTPAFTGSLLAAANVDWLSSVTYLRPLLGEAANWE
jgi:hypothetical protein